jgi:ATP-dependent Clp protease protease subunit
MFKQIKESPMKSKFLVAMGIATVVIIGLAAPLVVGNSAERDGVIVLSKDNVVVLNDVMMPDTTSAVIQKTKSLDGKSDKPIYIFLNTPGGSVQAGLEMFEALSGLDRPVNTVTLFAASMGFQTVQNLGERLILKNGVLMSHRATGEFKGSFGGRPPSQLDARYGLWLRRTLELDEQTVKRTKGKQTLTSYQAAYADELWLTGTEAVEQGYADRVVTVKCDKTLNGSVERSENVLGIIEVKYKISNCPINTGPSDVQIKIVTTVGPLTMEEFLGRGGMFGPGCLAAPDQNEKKKICALDTTLSISKIEELKSRFMERFQFSKTSVVPMSF